MNLESKVLPFLKKGLTDIRCIGAITHLRDLMIGKNTIGEPYYRFSDLEGNKIETIDDLITFLEEDSIELERLSVGTERYRTTLTGVRVKLTNVIMDTFEYRLGDKKIALEFGIGKKNPVFILSYWTDNDTELPLKLSYVDFENYKEVEKDA